MGPDFHLFCQGPKGRSNTETAALGLSQSRVCPVGSAGCLQETVPPELSPPGQGACTGAASTTTAYLRPGIPVHPGPALPLTLLPLAAADPLPGGAARSIASSSSSPSHAARRRRSSSSPEREPRRSSCIRAGRSSAEGDAGKQRPPLGPRAPGYLGARNERRAVGSRVASDPHGLPATRPRPSPPRQPREARAATPPAAPVHPLDTLLGLRFRRLARASFPLASGLAGSAWQEALFLVVGAVC